MNDPTDRLPTGDTDLERRVTDALSRRALDVPPDPAGLDRPLPVAGAPRPYLTETPGAEAPRPWLAVAAVLLMVGGGLAAVVGGLLLAGDDDGSTEVEAATESDAGVAVGPPVPEMTVAEIEATLPAGVDLRSGSMLWLDGDPSFDPRDVAERYLADRIPDLPTVLQAADVDDRDSSHQLHLFRWTLDMEDAQDLHGIAGWVVVRVGPERAGVVAATTDILVWDRLVRADGAVAIEASGTISDGIVVDVTDLHGNPVPDAPLPDGLAPETGRVFGTAGSSDEAPDGIAHFDAEVPVPPWPVAVRAQHVGGTWFTVAEVILEPTRFAGQCGSVPPLSIAVGDRLGELQEGASGRSSIEPIEGQGVWYHAATEASRDTVMEIRWPADPVLVGRLDSETITPDLIAQTPVGPSIISSDPFERVTGEEHVLLGVGPDAQADPCQVVQVSLLGDPTMASWLADAIAGQRLFGEELDLGSFEFEPAPPTSAGPAGEVETVVATLEVDDPAEVPRVALTGSCDGFPDDPPRTGGRVDAGHDTAGQALEAFLAGPIQDQIGPALPTAGYEEYVLTTDATRRSYVIPSGDDAAIVVVDVEEVEPGVWMVAGWEAAAC